MYHQINDPCHLSLLPHSEIIKWQHLTNWYGVSKETSYVPKKHCSQTVLCTFISNKISKCGYTYLQVHENLSLLKYFTKKYYTIAQRFFLNRHMYVLFNMINEIFISMPVDLITMIRILFKLIFWWGKMM